jgi:hypothetical protein
MELTTMVDPIEAMSSAAASNGLKDGETIGTIRGPSSEAKVAMTKARSAAIAIEPLERFRAFR